MTAACILAVAAAILLLAAVMLSAGEPKEP